MLIGGHVSTRGGLDKAIDNATAIGAAVFQVHPSSPQQWRPPALDDEGVARFTTKLAASGIRMHFFHASYLVNLASPRATLVAQSIDSLVRALDLAGRIGASGLIFHPGSHLGAGFEATFEQVGRAMRETLARTDSPAQLIVENSAGAGGCVGRGFDEVGRIVEAAGTERVGVCLDTCHLFASGYDVRTEDDVSRTLDAFESAVGFELLRIVHANDSKAPLGSNSDRHANIGEGEIWRGPFAWLLADERLRRVPWVLEVPGTDRSGPDLDNVNRLREAAGLEPAVAGATAGSPR